MMNLILGSVASSAFRPAPDPHFASVVLLASLDGDYVDDSDSAHTLTETETVNFATPANPHPFYDEAAFFDGGYVTLADSDDWAFGSGDFTIEFWCNQNQTSTDALMAQFGGSDKGWSIFSDPTDNFEFIISNAGGTSNITVFDYNWPASVRFEWVHVAISRVGDDAYLLIDGEIVATADMTGLSIRNSGRPFVLGANNNGSSASYEGWLSEVRFTKGVGRYSGVVTDTFNIVFPYPREGP